MSSRQCLTFAISTSLLRLPETGSSGTVYVIIYTSVEYKYPCLSSIVVVYHICHFHLLFQERYIQKKTHIQIVDHNHTWLRSCFYLCFQTSELSGMSNPPNLVWIEAKEKKEYINQATLLRVSSLYLRTKAAVSTIHSSGTSHSSESVLGLAIEFGL
jgi:hypothetical protein